MANIRVRQVAKQVIVTINGQDMSAEAFEATSSQEMGITTREAVATQEKIEFYREQIEQGPERG